MWLEENNRLIICRSFIKVNVISHHKDVKILRLFAVNQIKVCAENTLRDTLSEFETYIKMIYELISEVDGCARRGEEK